ncbi:MAG: hypothetical protein JO250_06985 [Armatimonadetes bacterium]|nr:hypothetical protein [Armatimonadota bacterium]
MRFRRLLRLGLVVGVIALAGTLLVAVLGPTRLVLIALAAFRKPPPVYAVNPNDGPHNAAKSGVTHTLFGITPFPYDTTLEAVRRTREIITPNTTLAVLHFDDGIPWKEALADAPFPSRIQREWEDDAKNLPTGRPVYLGFAPLDTDRKSLAPATGDQKRLPLPEELRGAPLDSPQVEAAYLNYARRAVRLFHPQYLNLGIEAGEIMERDFSRWPQLERLYGYVHDALKRQYPRMQIGISFGLADLRSQREAEAARPLIARSDYVGLSFYPYASPFEEMMGAAPYGGGPDAWRRPLAWVRAYTDKPIAICETGYSTQSIQIPQFGLNMPVDPAMQAQYVKELFQIARRDRYAFVVWFLAVDYDRMYARFPSGSDALKLWRNIGLWDGDVRPKPAWKVWQAGLAASWSFTAPPPSRSGPAVLPGPAR